MADIDNINQHLEMMIQKRSRCEDWVASVALRKRNRNIETGESKKTRYEDDDCEDEFSELSCSVTNAERRCRKKVNHRNSPISLICEWCDCEFTPCDSRIAFIRHVHVHIEDVHTVEKSDETKSYICLWESCKFDSTSSSIIRRHVCYHAYHTILKAAATELHNVWEIPSCRLSGEKKNCLPDLSHPFECNAVKCDFVTDFCNVYFDHVNMHLLDLKFETNRKKEVECVWKGCNKFKCRKRTLMKIHMRSHTGEKMLACPTCGAMFATNTKYMDHCTRKAAIMDECNRCQYCLRYFSNERLLRDHMRYHINSHKCSFCEMTCSTPSVLANHVRYRHLNERPFQCKECSFKSVKAEDLNEHSCSHDTEPRFQCQAEDCSFSCRAVTTFKNHFRVVHLMEERNVYCCHLCDKKYNRGSLLGNHLRDVHKLERPPGHSRFRYMKGVDGNFRLQVERYESLEINNADTRITSMDEIKQNYVLKQEGANEQSYEKFSIFFDENDYSNEGALIAIEEVDEEGKIIRTSTVREVTSLPTDDIVFVDVDAQLLNDSNVGNEANENQYADIPNLESERSSISTSCLRDEVEPCSNRVRTNSNCHVEILDGSKQCEVMCVKLSKKSRKKFFSDTDGVADEICIKFKE